MQFERSVLNGIELLSGSVALSGGHDAGETLSKLAPRALDEVASVGAETLAGSPVSQYRVGRHAESWSRRDPGPVWSRPERGRRLKDRSVDLYLRPAG